MPTNQLADDLKLAFEIADAADAVSLDGFNSQQFSVERKPDNSQVTEVDRNTELAIAKILRDKRPTHGVYGEEFGVTGDTDAKCQWVIDPIDGTANFVSGVPVWATLIALVDDGVPVLGVVTAPALAMRWWATTGGGAFYNSKPIHVSSTDQLGDASVSMTINKQWAKVGASTGLNQLQNDVARVRGYGDFWQHMLVAQGAIDVAIDAIGLAPYDIAAIVPIVLQAGGTFSDRHGAPNWKSNSLITSNSRLHSAVLDYLPR